MLCHLKMAEIYNVMNRRSYMSVKDHKTCAMYQEGKSVCSFRYSTEHAELRDIVAALIRTK